MAYDLHGAWASSTGINAPFKPSEFDVTPDDKQLNVEACINAWINAGADPSRLILGVPFYGRTFTLANEKNNGLNAPTTGPGLAGPYTREAGMIGYNEVSKPKILTSRSSYFQLSHNIFNLIIIFST